MVIVGIDPGLSGAVCRIDLGSRRTWVDRTPVIEVKGGKARYDSLAMARLIPDVCRVFIEDVHAMPGNGSVSMFRFGFGTGLWHGICAARGISPILIRPQEWKSALGLSRDKDASRDLASSLAPALSSKWKLKRDEGLAEAFLIAHYAKQVQQVAFTRYLVGG